VKEEDYTCVARWQARAFDSARAVCTVSEHPRVGSEGGLAAKCPELGPVCVGGDAGQASFRLHRDGVDLWIVKSS